MEQIAGQIVAARNSAHLARVSLRRAQGLWIIHLCALIFSRIRRCPLTALMASLPAFTIIPTEPLNKKQMLKGWKKHSR